MSYKEQAQELGIKIDGRWSEKRIKAEIAKVESETKEILQTAWNAAEIIDAGTVLAMNDLAKRIFDGQGSIPDIERVRMITNALRDKGYSEDEIKNLDLPIENLSKYLG